MTLASSPCSASAARASSTRGRARRSRTGRGSLRRSFAWPRRVLVGRASSKCGAALRSVASPPDWRRPAWIAFQTRSGVHGIRMSLTPKCRSASTIALTTAGVEAMVPASPTPLVPSVFVVDGDVGVVDVEADRVGRGRQQVVDERAGHQGAVRRRTPPPPTAPGRCPGRGRRAPGPSTISGLMMLPMSSTQTYLRIVSRAGLGVDLHRAQVGAVREGEVDRVERRVGVDARARRRRAGCAPSNVASATSAIADALVGALDARTGPPLNSRSSTLGLEQVRRDRLGLLDHLVGGPDQRLATDDERARAVGVQALVARSGCRRAAPRRPRTARRAGRRRSG